MTIADPFRRHPGLWIAICIISIGLGSCKMEKKDGQDKTAEVPVFAAKDVPAPHVVEIVTQNMDFKAPPEIPSGWVTLRYRNLSDMVHFVILEKLPEGKSLQDSREKVLPVFQKAMNHINEGNMDKGLLEFGNLPPWYADVVFCGGTGLISAGKTTETTLKIAPGNYMLECYVKMPNGQFHSFAGMTAAITATGEETEIAAPEPTINIRISSAKGISVKNDIKAGNHTVGVYFEDQKPHEHFIGHDLHLVKITEHADIEALASWMNWMDPEGFIVPAPGGFEFMGGSQEMAEGNTAFFNVQLTAGKYAWISEVPDPAGKNMLKIFTVSALTP